MSDAKKPFGGIKHSHPLSKPPKGRAADSNLPGRYDRQLIVSESDGWDQPDGCQPPSSGARSLVTDVMEETAKSILTRNRSPDLPFNVSMNPYRGCEHGCIYCYARPTHSYLDLSPGLDFESKIFAKVNAVELLHKALSASGYRVEPIAIGVNTDAYQPCEKSRCLTRGVLELLQQCRHPVGLITKSSLIERDIDILASMAQDNLVVASISLTTLDLQMARILEPRAASPLRRLRTIKRLSAAGVPVSVSISPVIPHITEPELEAILSAGAEAGAGDANYAMLRLPWEVNELFQRWLEVHFPMRAQKVMNTVRALRGGRENDYRFGHRLRGEGPWAELIQQRFRLAKKRLFAGSSQRFHNLNTQLFRAPAPNVSSIDIANQLDLFG